MTEEEAREALINLTFEYMKHPPKERLELYETYKEERAKIRKALSKSKLAKKEIQMKKK